VTYLPLGTTAHKQGRVAGTLLGAQLTGLRGTETAKRVDTYAAAPRHAMT
jgi:hypothetical protein